MCMFVCLFGVHGDSPGGKAEVFTKEKEAIS